MKAIILSILFLAIALPGFSQAPARPAGEAAQAPSAPPAQPASPASGAAATRADSPDAAASFKIVIPANTTIPLVLENTLNTRSAFVGQAVYCESIFPITVGNHIIIPKGSSVRGRVTQVVRPGHIRGRAQLGLRFDELVLPNGTTRHLRATLAGFGSEGDATFKPKEGKVQGAGSKGSDAGTVARTTIPGAELGTIIGAAKGAPLEGLGIGSAAGAATGLIWILARRGKEVVLPHGTSLDLLLSQPITFERDEVEPPSRYDAGPTMPRGEYGPQR